MLSVSLHILVYLTIILLLVVPLGWYMAQVLDGRSSLINKLMKPIELMIAKCCGLALHEEMDWKQYLVAMLWVNIFGMLLTYGILRLQYFLPLNPEHFANIKPDLALNTAASFVSNTNWQAYTGEASMSYFTQMFAFTVQQFLSAATGIALMMAFIRGLVRQQSKGLGNFWQDCIRSVMFILLPLCIILSLILISQGVIQNFKAYVDVNLLDTSVNATQRIPMGPVASMAAIKIIGSNGGGFFGVNAAHPFENPNMITNYLQLITIILLPAALCYTFGSLVNDKRQGFAMLIAMILIFTPLAFIAMHAEQIGNPMFSNLNLLEISNMEGKEVRFGPMYSALWGAATTATANGSVNSMHDSVMPISSFVYLILMQMGEIVFGGGGSGLYSMILMIIISVFIGGLMVGRSPEYLGKRIEPHELKMISFVVLILTSIVLICTAFSCVTSYGLASVANPGAHGFSEILYAWTSMRNNNGSAMAGLNANTPFYNIVGAFVMLIGRYWTMLGLLAVAGSLALKKRIPVSIGTLHTHDATFVWLLLSIIVIVGISSFLPALALGPIVEHLMLWKIT